MVKINNYEQSNLTPFQRQEMILDYINQHSSASVKQLAETFFLHEATVRRDLNALAKSGRITRVHGGAAVADALLAEIPLYVREAAFKDIKRDLARRASTLVRDGSTIFIDSSSTATMMVPFLESKKNLRIVTDGAQTGIQLAKLKDAQIYSVGGSLGGKSMSFLGPIALQNLQLFHFDHAFFSCRGVTLEHGLSDTSDEAAFFRRLLTQRSERPVLLVDHSKIGVTSFFGICPLEKIHTLITNAHLDESWHLPGLRLM